MMEKINLMIFDFDGTIVNTGDDLAAAVNYSLDKLGIPLLKNEDIIGYIGDGVKMLIERSLGNAFPEKFDEALSIFMTYYGEHLLDSTVLYPGVLEILDHYKSKVKVVVTNKLYSYTLRIAEELDIANYFDKIIGMDSAPYKKPDSRLLDPLIEEYGAERHHTIVIGDGINDILLAKNAGVVSCALLDGLGSRDKLLQLKPDYVCENIIELIKLFE
jgi:phosphoglycolate phosphatase